MPSRFPVAVHVFLPRDDSVLMLRRSNTGYEDGRLSVVAGHVEAGESVTEAAVREIREEVDVELSDSNLRVAGVMHRRADEERVDFFLVCKLGASQPRNAEPDKCSELVWAPLAEPPADTIPYVKRALENFRENRWFDEFGWKTSTPKPSGGLARDDPEILSGSARHLAGIVLHRRRSFPEESIRSRQ